MEQPPESATGWGAGKHAVELYVRTYTTMLQSSGEIKIDSLVQTHIRMGSVLHPLAGQPQSDMGALLYGVRRLPRAIERCRHVVMGQSAQGFRAVLGADILDWQPVKAPARRRRWYQGGNATLAVLIASTSDIDDLVPSLVAYQIEWNKLHRTSIWPTSPLDRPPEPVRMTGSGSMKRGARLSTPPSRRSSRTSVTSVCA